MNKPLGYNELRGYSDKSIPHAKKYIMRFLYTHVDPTEEYDDITNSTDLIFQMPQVRFAHRSRKKTGYNITDVTIKTESKHGKYRYNGEQILTEFDKLKAYQTGPQLNFYYFYCFYDEHEDRITRYIIYDLKRIIELPEFSSRGLFIYQEDKENGWDGGSKFNCISLDVLRHHDCILVDYSTTTPPNIEL